MYALGRNLCDIPRLTGIAQLKIVVIRKSMKREGGQTTAFAFQKPDD